ncbi:MULTISPECIES: glycosyltransferase [unclassified Photorhabdus]|uniref:glycosyltransferase n=1 Tax=unclassified Photorhabdus TaxID=2620880 RepID=UPI000DCF167D|nr:MULTISPECIES: nucleotide disphospho-sugar-binding domain-containing protein [unclassified Photorhabdus]RAX01751.1 N-glycosyltransferase [Photorhabdus sp. S9-53]RAX02490.1 N-glycosyltransferase [Photorhabdus sp. S10-54]RAX05529.1 N-glycosyltransferase [Photorhabdus sp. S8-52]
MARIVIAAVATPGHVYPMLKVTQSLIAQGHQVTVFTGALFRQQVEALNAQFIPFDEQIDFDYRHLKQRFPDRAHLPPGNLQMALAFKDFFCTPIPFLDRQLQQIIHEQQAELLIAENCFYGILPLLQKEKAHRLPVIIIGITPLAYSSKDSIFWGPRIPPALLPSELTHEQLVDEETRQLITEVQDSFNDALAQSGCATLTRFFNDEVILGSDRFLQLSTLAFEYPREELPDTVHFIGPLPNPAPITESPQLWEEGDPRPLVIVTQGTMSNTDLNQLIFPTLRALAALPVRVLATTGGSSVEIQPENIPDNACIEEFISFEHWLPKASLLISNGGYGTINYALNHGTPVLIADTGEGKQETAFRVVWAGCGINLDTAQPTESQLKQTVENMLRTNLFKQRAQIVQDDYSNHDALAAISHHAEQLIFENRAN